MGRYQRIIDNILKGCYSEAKKDDVTARLVFRTLKNLRELNKKEEIPFEVVIALKPYLEFREDENIEDEAVRLLSEIFVKNPEYLLKIKPELHAAMPVISADALKIYWCEKGVGVDIKRIDLEIVLKLAMFIDPSIKYLDYRGMMRETRELEELTHHYAVHALEIILLQREDILKKLLEIEAKSEDAEKILKYLRKYDLIKGI